MKSRQITPERYISKLLMLIRHLENYININNMQYALDNTKQSVNLNLHIQQICMTKNMISRFSSWHYLNITHAVLEDSNIIKVTLPCHYVRCFVKIMALDALKTNCGGNINTRIIWKLLVTWFIKQRQCLEPLLNKQKRL